jgi:hypothetical protein
LPIDGKGVAEFTGVLLAMLESCSGYRRVHLLLCAQLPTLLPIRFSTSDWRICEGGKLQSVWYGVSFFENPNQHF